MTRITLLFTLALLLSPVYAIDIGKKAPDFSLPDVRSGEVVTLSKAANGRPVAVMFIATGCPYSNAFNLVMNELSRKYSAQGVKFLAINSNKTEPTLEVKSHAEENGFVFSVLKDEGNTIADQYTATVTPEVFLLNAAGEVVYHGALGNSRQPTTKVEEADGAELSLALDQMLSGEAATPAKTKMFGCTIKR